MTWQPDYATVAELKAYVRIEVADTADDTTLGLAITAASRAVDLTTYRQFGLVAAPEARTYTAHWDRLRLRWVIEIDDLMTTTGLTVTTAAGTITAYTKQPTNAAQEGRPWTRLVVQPSSAVQPPYPPNDEDGVTVTAQWGWSAVPNTVKQATLLQASRLFSRRNAPFGVAGSPDLGSEMRLLEKVDPDVAVTLGAYTRFWPAVA